MLSNTVSVLVLFIIICLLPNYIKCGAHKKQLTHVKIIVPEIVNHHHHTKIVYAYPKPGYQGYKRPSHIFGHHKHHGFGPGPRHKPKHERRLNVFKHKHKTHHEIKNTVHAPYKGPPLKPIKALAPYYAPQYPQIRYTKTIFEPYSKNYKKGLIKTSSGDHSKDNYKGFDDNEFFKEYREGFNSRYTNDDFIDEFHNDNKEKSPYKDHYRKHHDDYKVFKKPLDKTKKLKEDIKEVKSHHLEVETFTPDEPSYTSSGYQVEEKDTDKIDDYNDYYSLPIKDEHYSPDSDTYLHDSDDETHENFYNSEDYAFPKQDIHNYETYFNKDKDDYKIRSITFDEFVKGVEKEANSEYEVPESP